MLALLLCAALAQEDARARLDEAWRRVELGDPAGARLVAVEARQLAPELSAEALYVEGIAWQEEHHPSEAATSYRAILDDWPQSPLARDARFRLAWATADAGDPARALRELRRIGSHAALAEADPSGVDLTKVRLFEAAFLTERGAARRGYRALADALAHPAAADVPWFVARARLAVLRYALDEAEALDLAPPPRAAHELDVRALFVQEADAQVSAIVDTRQTGPILEALIRLGDHYVDLADDIEAAGVPAGVTGDTRDIYLAKVESRADQQRVKALRYWELGTQLVLSTGWVGPERQAIEARAAAMSTRLESPP